MTSNEQNSNEISSYDHYPRFRAIELHLDRLTSHMSELLSSHAPQDIEFGQYGGELLLSPEEIKSLWGRFPATARSRAQPNPPVINFDSPRWFAQGSSSAGPIITDKLENAISPTANGLAHTETETGTIVLHGIPDNGFSQEVNRLVQAGVVVHELAHTIVNAELWNPSLDYHLQFVDGRAISAPDWFVKFLLAAETHPPISHYASGYRNPDNSFPRENEAFIFGIALNEEVTDSITANILGYSIGSAGLTFDPFTGREDIHDMIKDYLSAQPIQ